MAHLNARCEEASLCHRWCPRPATSLYWLLPPAGCCQGWWPIGGLPACCLWLGGTVEPLPRMVSLSSAPSAHPTSHSLHQLLFSFLFEPLIFVSTISLVFFFVCVCVSTIMWMWNLLCTVHIDIIMTFFSVSILHYCTFSMTCIEVWVSWIFFSWTCLFLKNFFKVNLWSD